METDWLNTFVLFREADPPPFNRSLGITNNRHKLVQILFMKTIPEYLTGQFDEELNMLVAEAKYGWTDFDNLTIANHPDDHARYLCGSGHKEDGWNRVHPFSTSLDACHEFLEDLTKEEWFNFRDELDNVTCDPNADYRNREQRFICATARQICVAYLIVKGVLK